MNGPATTMPRLGEQEIDARLVEWGRWLRTRLSQGHCASIEYQFHWKKRPDDTPTGWGDWHWSDKAAIQFLPPVNTIQALAVERVMRNISVQHREALALHYVYRIKATFACRALAIKYADWDKFLGDACLMCANLLQFNKKRNLMPENSSPPVATEILAPIGAG